MGYANVFRPMGFVPFGDNGRTVAALVPRPVAAVRHASSGGNASTDIAIGDAYAIDANGNAYRAGPNDAVRGIVCGLRFLGNANVMAGQGPISFDYIAGLMGGSGTAVVAYILGCEDPIALWTCAIQSGDSFTAANVGMKVNLVDAAPDATYAQSRQSINISTGAGSQFEVPDIAQITASNAYGVNAQVVVRMLQTFNNG